MFLTILLTLFGVVSSGFAMWKIKNRCKSRSKDLPSKISKPFDSQVSKFPINDEKLIDEIDEELLNSNTKDTNVYLPILEDSEDDELDYCNDSKNELCVFSI